jgi:transposase
MPVHQDASSEVIIGVDTHDEIHVAAAINGLGQILEVIEIPSNRAGYRQLFCWARRLGWFERAGIEGTGSYGAGLARYLIDSGIAVIEVDRPNRQRRRRRGKSDAADAEAAARAVLAGEAATIAKDTTSTVEAIRMLTVARRSAVKAQVQTGNQMKDIIVTAPEQIRDQLSDKSTRQRVKICAAWRPTSTIGDPTSAARYTLWTLARRWQTLNAEIKELNKARRPLIHATVPTLLAEHGVGEETAAALVIAAGQNPDRLKTEGSFAALCGTSPVDASTGKQQHHRLNRGGNRQANAALYTITMVRWRDCPETAAFIAKQRAKGKTDRHTRRCIKRALARRFHHIILHDLTRHLT